MKTKNEYDVLYNTVNHVAKEFKLTLDSSLKNESVKLIATLILSQIHPENINVDPDTSLIFSATKMKKNKQIAVSYSICENNNLTHKTIEIALNPQGRAPNQQTLTIIPKINNTPSFLKHYGRFIRKNPTAAVIGNIIVFILIAPIVALYRTVRSSSESRESERLARKEIYGLSMNNPIGLKNLFKRRVRQLESIGDITGAAICRQSIKFMHMIENGSGSKKKLEKTVHSIMNSIRTSVNPNILPVWLWDGKQFSPFLVTIQKIEGQDPAKYKINLTRGWSEEKDTPFQIEYENFTDGQVNALVTSLLNLNGYRKPGPSTLPGNTNLIDYIRFPMGMNYENITDKDLENIKYLNIKEKNTVQKGKKSAAETDSALPAKIIFDILELISQESQQNQPPIDNEQQENQRTVAIGKRPKNNWELIFQGMNSIQGYGERSEFLIDTLNEELEVYIKSFDRLSFREQQIAIEQLEAHLKELKELLGREKNPSDSANLTLLIKIFSTKIESLKNKKNQLISTREAVQSFQGRKGLKVEKENQVGVKVDKSELPKSKIAAGKNYLPIYPLHRQQLEELRLSFRSIDGNNVATINSVEKQYDAFMTQIDTLLNQGEYEAAYVLALEIQKMIPHPIENANDFWTSTYFKPEQNEGEINPSTYFAHTNEWSQRITKLTKFQWESSLKLQKMNIAPAVIYQNIKTKAILISLNFDRYKAALQAANQNDPRVKSALEFRNFKITTDEIDTILAHPYATPTYEEELMVNEIRKKINALKKGYSPNTSEKFTGNSLAYKTFSFYREKKKQENPMPENANLAQNALHGAAEYTAEIIPDRDTNQSEEFLTNEMVDFIECSIYFQSILNPAIHLYPDYAELNPIEGIELMHANVNLIGDQKVKLAKKRDKEFIVTKNRINKMRRLQIKYRAGTALTITMHHYLISDPTQRSASSVVFLLEGESPKYTVIAADHLYDYKNQRIVNNEKTTGYDGEAYLCKAARWAKLYVGSSSWNEFEPLKKYYNRLEATTQAAIYREAIRSDSTNPHADALFKAARHHKNMRSIYNIEHALHLIVTRPDLIEMEGGCEYLEFLISQPNAINKALENPRTRDQIIWLLILLAPIIESKKSANLHSYCTLVKVVEAIKIRASQLQNQVAKEEDNIFINLPTYHNNPTLENFLKSKFGTDQSEIAKFHYLQILHKKLVDSNYDLKNLAPQDHRLLFEATQFLNYMGPRYGFPMRAEEIKTDIALYYLPQMIKAENGNTLLGILQNGYNEQKTDLTEFAKTIKLGPFLHKRSPIAPSDEWVPKEGHPFIYTSGDYEFNIFTGQFLIGGKKAEFPSFDANLPKKVTDNEQFRKLFDPIPELVQVRQGDIPGEWIYRMKNNGREFEVCISDSSAEISIRVKVDRTDSGYPKSEWFQWQEATEEAPSGIGQAISETGIWVSVKDPKRGLYVLNRTQHWPTEDFYRIKLSNNGKILKVENQYHEIITPDFDRSISRFFRQADPKHLIFSRDPKSSKLSRLRMTDFPLEMTFNNGKWEGLGNYEGYSATFNGENGTEECKAKSKQIFHAMGGLANDMVLRLGNGADQKWIIWPKKIIRSNARVAPHTEYAESGPLELTINKKGQLDGSAATFLYLAYYFYQKKDYQSAIRFLKMAETHPIGDNKKQLELIREFIRSEPSRSKRGAIFQLKVELMLHRLQSQFVTPMNNHEITNQALLMNDRYQILQGKLGVDEAQRRGHKLNAAPILIKRGEQSLELTAEEHAQLLRIMRSTQAALVKDPYIKAAAAKQVKLGKNQERQTLSKSAIGHIVAMTVSPPKRKGPSNRLLHPLTLTADTLLKNFFFYYNHIVTSQQQNETLEFLVLPFDEILSTKARTKQEERLLAAALEAQEFLRYVRSNPGNFKKIKIDDVLKEQRNILPLVMDLKHPIRSALKSGFKITGRILSVPIRGWPTEKQEKGNLSYQIWYLSDQSRQLNKLNKLLSKAQINTQDMNDMENAIQEAVVGEVSGQVEYPLDPDQLNQLIGKEVKAEAEEPEKLNVEVELVAAVQKFEKESGIPVSELTALKEAKPECERLETQARNQDAAVAGKLAISQPVQVQNENPMNLATYFTEVNNQTELEKLEKIRQQFVEKFAEANAGEDRVLREEFAQVRKGAETAHANLTKKVNGRRTIQADNLEKTESEMKAYLTRISKQKNECRASILQKIKNNNPNGNIVGIPELKNIQDRLLNHDLTYSEEEAIFELLSLIQQKHPVGLLKNTLETFDVDLMSYVKLAKAEFHLTESVAAIAKLNAANKTKNQPDLNSEDQIAALTKIHQTLLLALDFNRFLDPNSHTYTRSEFKKIEIQEFKVGLLLRQEQIDAILSFSDKPNQAQAFRMGFGKTYGVLPTLAEIFCDQGKFVVGVLPKPLKDINLISFDEMTRRGYGRRAHPFEIGLADELSPSLLAEKYKTLLQIKNDGGYVLSSRDTFDNIKTMLRSLVLEESKLVKAVENMAAETDQPMSDEAKAKAGKQQQELIIKLALTREKIVYLSKIEAVLNDEKTQFIVDEADSEFDINKTINRSIGATRPTDPIIMEQTNLIFDVLLDDSLKAGSSLFGFREKIIAGTQSDINPVEFKEIYLPEIAKSIIAKLQTQKKLKKKMTPEQINQWVSYLTGASDQKPDDFDARGANSEKFREELGALKHLLSLSLESLFMKKIGDHFRASDANGAIFVPTENGVEVPGVLFGSEYDLALHNYLGYIQFKQGQSTTDATQRFMTDSLKNMQQRELHEWEELKTIAESLHMSPKEAIYEPAALKIRLFIYREYVLQQNRIQISEEFIKMSAQDSLRGRNASMVTGTLNPYLLPNCDVEFWSRKGAPSRIQIEAEVYFNALLKHENAGETVVATFDLDQALKYTDDLLADDESIAIINQGGYGMEGLTTRQYVTNLRKGENGKNRNFIFIDLDQGNRRRSYYWNKDSADPIPFDSSQKIPPNTVVIYGMQDTRGTDFKMGKGKIHLLVNPTSNQASASQAIMRGRETGGVQQSVWHKPIAKENEGRDQEEIQPEPEESISMLDVIDGWVRRSVSDQKVQAEKSAIKRSDDVIQEVVENILFSAKKSLLDQMPDAEKMKDQSLDPKKAIAGLELLVASVQTDVLKKFFIKKKKPDHLSDFAPSEKIETTAHVLASYDEAIADLKKAKKALTDQLVQEVRKRPEFSNLNRWQKIIVMLPILRLMKPAITELDKGIAKLEARKQAFTNSLAFNERFLAERTFKGVKNDSGEQEQTQTFTMTQEKSVELEQEKSNRLKGDEELDEHTYYRDYTKQTQWILTQEPYHKPCYSADFIKNKFEELIPRNGTYSEYLVIHILPDTYFSKRETLRLEGVNQQDYDLINELNEQTPIFPTDFLYNNSNSLLNCFRILPNGALAPTSASASKHLEKILNDSVLKKQFVVSFVLYKIEWGFGDGQYSAEEQAIIAEWAKEKPEHMNYFKNELIPKLKKNNVHPKTIHYVTKMVEGKLEKPKGVQ
jgi:hypothetical protein